MTVGQRTATRSTRSRIKAARGIVEYLRYVAGCIELEVDAADAFIKIDRRDLAEQPLAHVTRLVAEVAA